MRYCSSKRDGRLASRKPVKVNCKLHSQKLYLKRLEKQLTPTVFHSGSPGKSNGRYTRLTTHFHLLLRFTYTYPLRKRTASCLPCSCHLLIRTLQLIPHPCSQTGTGSTTTQSKRITVTRGKKLDAYLRRIRILGYEARGLVSPLRVLIKRIRRQLHPVATISLLIKPQSLQFFTHKRG